MAKQPEQKSELKPEKEPEKAGEADNGGALEGIVERQLDPVLSNLSKVQRDQVISKVVRVVQAEKFSGPLPHPRHLSEYDAILPGGAERIFTLVETTMDHNMGVQNKAQKDDHHYRLIGMGLGFLALVLLVGAAFYAGMHGNNILAGLFLGTGVLSSIGVFVSAHLRKDQ